MRRLLILMLGFILMSLQVRIWIGENSVSQMVAIRQQIEHQKRQNDRLLQRNQSLAREVVELQNGLQTLEEYARTDLGMVRKDEIFYLIYE